MLIDNHNLQARETQHCFECDVTIRSKQNHGVERMFFLVLTSTFNLV